MEIECNIALRNRPSLRQIRKSIEKITPRITRGALNHAITHWPIRPRAQKIIPRKRRVQERNRKAQKAIAIWNIRKGRIKDTNKVADGYKLKVIIFKSKFIVIRLASKYKLKIKWKFRGVPKASINHWKIQPRGAQDNLVIKRSWNFERQN